MGCVGSKQLNDNGSSRKLRKPKPWQYPRPITRAELAKMREEFWDTQPQYGGRKEIWETLRAAAEVTNLAHAQLLLDCADIIVSATDMSVCHDERGTKYELPLYVLREPTNLIRGC
ncbi:uncharacterized protein LOC144701330 [Wolffia australiana]